ncbi:hypothetical protein DL764_006595 [Monosporascus ibericus]|uniref:Uncharacterized protein n=1 Tax=Monosporascus ibericus TaxID=155417 RepID=A0A4Q4T4C4_9PEZI|nr:hypothetical protein DL764_006595 [Monosporascus ibericus]
MEHGEQNPAADLEKGYGKHDRVAAHCVRDVTYRVIPICAVILVFFSDGAILVCTLAFDKPVPRQGAVGISIMLAVLFFLFGLGGMYVYWKEHPRPAPKVANSLERPPPENTRRDKTVSMLRTLKKRGKRLTSYVSNRSRSDDTSSRIIDGLDGVHTRSPRRSDRAEFVQTRTSDELTIQHPAPPGHENYEQGEAVAAHLQRNTWVQVRGTNRVNIPQNARIQQPGAPLQPNTLNRAPGGAHANSLQTPARADPLQAIHQYRGENRAYDSPRVPQGPDRAPRGGHVGDITSAAPAGYNARPSHLRANPQTPHTMAAHVSHQRNLFNQSNPPQSDTRSVASARGHVNEFSGWNTGGARVNLARVPDPPYLTEEAEAAYLQSELTNWIGARARSALVSAAAQDGIESSAAAAAAAPSPPERAGSQGSLRSADKSSPAPSIKPLGPGATKTTTPPSKFAAGTSKRRQKRAGDKSPAAYAHGRARSAAASFEAGFHKLEADHASQQAALQRLSEVLRASRPEQRAAVPARQPATPDTEGKGAGIEMQRLKQRQEQNVTPKWKPLPVTGGAGGATRKVRVRIMRTTPRRRRRRQRQRSPRKAASLPAAWLSMVKRLPGKGPAPPPLAERAYLPLPPRRSSHSRRAGVVSGSSGSASVSTWKR